MVNQYGLPVKSIWLGIRGIQVFLEMFRSTLLVSSQKNIIVLAVLFHDSYEPRTKKTWMALFETVLLPRHLINAAGPLLMHAIPQMLKAPFSTLLQCNILLSLKNIYRQYKDAKGMRILWSWNYLLGYNFVIMAWYLGHDFDYHYSIEWEWVCFFQWMSVEKSLQYLDFSTLTFVRKQLINLWTDSLHLSELYYKSCFIREVTENCVIIFLCYPNDWLS